MGIVMALLPPLVLQALVCLICVGIVKYYEIEEKEQAAFDLKVRELMLAESGRGVVA